jgi:hypothetical protein
MNSRPTALVLGAGLDGNLIRRLSPGDGWPSVDLQSGITCFKIGETLWKSRVTGD